MLIFTLAVAMTLAMLIATFLRLHSESKYIKIRDQVQDRRHRF